jgi:hypothetical protein
LKEGSATWMNDGLNNLDYTIVDKVELRPLFTDIFVDLKEVEIR